MLVEAREARRGEAGLTERFPAARTLELVVADVADAASMRAMAKRTRVICTTVGPYGRLGDAVVEACIAEGTDCCDLTGEVNWMRKNIDAHHERAVADKTRIVHAAGFDSIPFDIGVYALQKAAVERLGGPAPRCVYTIGSGRVLWRDRRLHGPAVRRHQADRTSSASWVIHMHSTLASAGQTRTTAAP